MTAASAAGSLEEESLILQVFDQQYGVIDFHKEANVWVAFRAGWKAAHNLKIVEMKDGE